MRATPPTTDRETYQQRIDTLRVREKAHTREGDARWLPARHIPHRHRPRAELPPVVPATTRQGVFAWIPPFSSPLPKAEMGSPSRGPLCRRAISGSI